MPISRLTRSLALLLCILLPSSVCVARTWLVPSEAATIQAGIELAAAGDTVLVSCGIYYEHDITLKSGVTVRSETGQADCVTVDGQELGRLMDCVDAPAPTRVEGFTLTGGKTTVAWIDGMGGGIRCMNGNLEVRRCAFTDNSASEIGGGLGIENSTIVIEDCEFTSNHNTSDNWAAGGGLYCRFSAGAVERCTFTANSAFSSTLPGDGGGAFIRSSQLAIVDCSFLNNSTGAGAGGLYSVLGDESILTRCHFEGNTADFGGAVYLEESLARFYDCSFHANTGRAGGAIYIGGRDATSQFWNCDFTSNEATQQGGGAIKCWISNPTFWECAFRDNNCVGDGGAIDFTASDPRFEDCIFADNQSTHRGGAVSGRTSALILTSCTIDGNAAVTGGGIYCNTGATAQLENTLITFAIQGSAVAQSNIGAFAFSCCNIFGNMGGDWTGENASQLGQNGNISLDPLYCRELNPDQSLGLANESPCVPANNPTCGLIGALPAGCTATQATVTFSPMYSGPIDCDQTTPVNIQYLPDDSNSPVRGYEIRVQATGSASFTRNDITVQQLPPGSQIFSSIVDNGPSDCTVTYALLGTTSGFFSETSLFEIQLLGQLSGSASVAIVSAELRDLDNVPISVDFVDVATIDVDCPGLPAVTDVTAQPRHGIIALTWTDPDVPALEAVEVWRGLWHDGGGASVYPEYDDEPGNVVPGRPADHDEIAGNPEWVMVGSVDPGEQSFNDRITPRGVYYYELFARNILGDYSVPMASSVRATNYWLGDVVGYDGNLDTADLSLLGIHYGTTPADGALYNPECDVGPTDDASATGIPTTDDAIDFEDLLIFAFNYGEVAPKTQAGISGDPAVLAWERISDAEWRLRLVAPCPHLKGLRVRAAAHAGQAPTIIPGHLLQEQVEPVFVRNIARNGLDVSIAVLGRGLGMSGSGELLRVSTPSPMDFAAIRIEARDILNRELAHTVAFLSAPEVPSGISLAQNSPNPFNPVTKFSFSLPQEESVKLRIFSVGGKLVATLVDGVMPAGHHEAVWAGRDQQGSGVASGIYFYRLDAGSFSKTRKMSLLK